MSNYVEVRGVRIGEGVPKICVPIVGKTKEEILAAAKSFADVKMDVVEWRVDWFDGVFDFAQVEDVLKDLRPALGNTPILFTFRTSKEGGEKAIEPDVYVELNKKAAATGLVDLVDVEAFTGDSYVKEIIEAAHEAGVAVVASNHDFDKTPYKRRICRTGAAGLFLPGRGGYTACHLTEPCDFLKICVDALVKAVCLTEIFFCRHAETSFRILSMIYSPSRAVRLLYHAERKNASNSVSSASGVPVLRYRRR